MILQCRTQAAAAYRSGSQVARALTEDWCSRELYCSACDSDTLLQSRPNSPASDFTCPRCTQSYELKRSRIWKPRKIVDAGYEAMLRAIRQDKAPNLLFLHYSSEWRVANLLLVPRVFFTESVIEKRKPLSPSARRAGWVGCNILLEQIPEDGKITLVSAGAPIPAKRVREEFSRVRRLAELPPSKRGWTVDVLALVRRLGKPHFSLSEIYNFEAELQAVHPQNRNIRPKIRQQLQVLRDLGLIEFTSPGTYAVRP
jgi:type II restriction enzyme